MDGNPCGLPIVPVQRPVLVVEPSMHAIMAQGELERNMNLEFSLLNQIKIKMYVQNHPTHETKSIPSFPLFIFFNYTQPAR
jgi:hypothetical protein